MALEDKRVESLHLGQDLDFQRRSWRLQRLGWSAMGVMILAALLGLFGTGPLSSVTVSSQDEVFTLQYNRFWRLQSPMELRLSVTPDPDSPYESRVGLGQTYLDKVWVQYVIPPPQRVEAAAESLIYVFSLASTQHPVQITFVVEPQRPGRLNGRFALHDKVSLHFSQFIYP